MRTVTSITAPQAPAERHGSLFAPGPQLGSVLRDRWWSYTLSPHAASTAPAGCSADRAQATSGRHERALTEPRSPDDHDWPSRWTTRTAATCRVNTQPKEYPADHRHEKPSGGRLVSHDNRHRAPMYVSQHPQVLSQVGPYRVPLGDVITDAPARSIAVDAIRSRRRGVPSAYAMVDTTMCAVIGAFTATRVNRPAAALVGLHHALEELAGDLPDVRPPTTGAGQAHTGAVDHNEPHPVGPVRRGELGGAERQEYPHCPFL